MKITRRKYSRMESTKWKNSRMEIIGRKYDRVEIKSGSKAGEKLFIRNIAARNYEMKVQKDR
jgi:hypothetical protein